MSQSPISYKPIDPRCDLKVRELNRHKVARRLISNNKRKIASAGLLLEAPEEIAAGALIEIDLSFPGMDMIYRSRGIIDYKEPSPTPGKNKVGVLIFGMDKIDPNSVEEPAAPKAEQKSAVAAAPAAASEQADAPAAAPAAASEQADAPAAAPVAANGEADAPAAAPAAANEQADAPAAGTEPQAAASAPASQSAPAADARQPGMTMPDDEDIGELFGGLVDAAVEVTENTDKPLKPKRFAAVGEYLNDEDETVVIFGADIALTNYLGSALLMMPAEEAENGIKNNTMSEEVEESFQEIYNISASLINDAGNQHVKFSKMYLNAKGKFEPNIAKIVENPSNTYHTYVDIPGYGKGRLTIIDGTWK